MIYLVGSQVVEQTPGGGQPTASLRSDPLFKWNIRLYYKSGGLKKSWYIGQQDCPIQQINLELNLKICGAGSMNFAFIDFPMDGGDYIEIYYNGVIKYRAQFDSTADKKGGKIKLIPYAERFNDLLINNSFASKTISEMLQTIVQDLQSDTKISWNPSLVSTGEVETYTLDFSKYDSAKKVIDELVKKLDDRYWGVDANNQFTVYTLQSATYDKYFLHGDVPFFSSIDIKLNLSQIKATRYQVFKKTAGAGEVTRIGEVGAGGSYPILTDIENLLGESRVGKFIASEVLADADALDLAYETLKADTTTPKTIKGNDLDISKYFPTIGHYGFFQDRIEQVLETIIDCESLTNWISPNPLSLSTTDPVEGSANIRFSTVVAVVGNRPPVYDFGEIKRFHNPTKIVMMIKSSVAGYVLQLSTAKYRTAGLLGACSSGAASSTKTTTDYIFNTVRPIYISNASVWQLVTLDIISSDFQFLGFIKGDKTATIEIDRIQLFMYHRQEDSGNIVKAEFNIDSNSENCDIEASRYDLQANDNIFRINREIEKIIAVQDASA